MAERGTSHHDICLRLNKFVITFVVHPLQSERWKRKYFLCPFTVLYSATIYHVGAFNFLVVLNFKNLRLTPFSFLIFFLSQIDSLVHLLVCLGTQMQGTILRQDIERDIVVP